MEERESSRGGTRKRETVPVRGRLLCIREGKAFGRG